MATANPQYCAMTVPKATPTTSLLKTMTKMVLSTMFITLVVMAIAMGILVFCIPTNQPLKQ